RPAKEERGEEARWRVQRRGAFHRAIGERSRRSSRPTRGPDDRPLEGDDQPFRLTTSKKRPGTLRVRPKSQVAGLTRAVTGDQSIGDIIEIIADNLRLRSNVEHVVSDA